MKQNDVDFGAWILPHRGWPVHMLVGLHECVIDSKQLQSTQLIIVRLSNILNSIKNN